LLTYYALYIVAKFTDFMCELTSAMLL